MPATRGTSSSDRTRRQRRAVGLVRVRARVVHGVMEEQRQAHRLGVCHRDLSHEVLGRSEHGREVGHGVVVPLGSR